MCRHLMFVLLNDRQLSLDQLALQCVQYSLSRWRHDTIQSAVNHHILAPVESRQRNSPVDSTTYVPKTGVALSAQIQEIMNGLLNIAQDSVQMKEQVLDGLRKLLQRLTDQREQRSQRNQDRIPLDRTNTASQETIDNDEIVDPVNKHRRGDNSKTNSRAKQSRKRARKDPECDLALFESNQSNKQSQSQSSTQSNNQTVNQSNNQTSNNQTIKQVSQIRSRNRNRPGIHIAI